MKHDWEAWVYQGMGNSERRCITCGYRQDGLERDEEVPPCAGPRMCHTLGHENVPAVALGTFHDREDIPDVAYCQECVDSLAAGKPGDTWFTPHTDLRGTPTCITCRRPL